MRAMRVSVHAATVLLLLLGAAALAGGCAGDFVRTSEGRLLESTETSEVGVTFARHGLWGRAEGAWKEALGTRAREASLHFNLGVAAERRGRDGTAAELFAEALELEPKAPYMKALARVTGRSPSPDHDERLLEEGGGSSAFVGSDDSLRENEIAVQLARHGLWERARTRWRSLRDALPFWAVPAHNLAVDGHRRGDRSSAEALARAAADLEASDPTLQLLGEITGRRGHRFDLATVLESGAEELDRGRAYARAGLWREAIEIWNELTDGQYAAAAYYNLATGYQALGELDRALDAANRAVEQRPIDKYVSRLAKIEKALGGA